MKKLFPTLSLLVLTISLFAQAPTNGLVAYYPFNGNANDESGNGNHGTVYGAILTKDRFGNNEKAYSFDGVDDYIDVISISSTSLDKTFTISAWVKFNNFNISYPHILGGHNNFIAFHGFGPAYPVVDRGKVSFYFDPRSPTVTQHTKSNFKLEEGVYYHVLAIRDNSLVKLYVDGVFHHSIDNPNSMLSGDFIWIGRSPSHSQTAINGVLDDIRIYNRALTDLEVQAIYLSEGGEVHNDVSILNLEEPFNKASYTVPREATVHHYFLAKSTTTGEPLQNVTLNYVIGTDPTIRQSLPSDEDGLIDLNILTGGEDPEDENDDWLSPNNNAYPVQFHSLKEGLITGENVFASSPFNIRVIEKEAPLDKEIGVGVGFKAGGDVFALGGKLKYKFAGYQLNLGLKFGLSLGATADGFMRIKPHSNPRIWDVYFNNGVGTSIGLGSDISASFGNKNVKLDNQVDFGVGLENAVRTEKGFTFDLDDRDDVLRLAHFFLSSYSYLPSAKTASIIFKRLFEYYTNESIYAPFVSSATEFGVGADYALNTNLEASVKVRAINFPGYGNIPAIGAGIKLNSEGKFFDNIIFETNSQGNTITNALNIDFTANAAVHGLAIMTKGNRKNNPTARTQPMEVFDESFNNEIKVSSTLDWNNLPASSSVSISSKSEKTLIHGGLPHKYNITVSNNFNYGKASTGLIYSNYYSNYGLQLNSFADFITLNSRSLVGSAWKNMGVSESLFQQAYDLNTWVVENTHKTSPFKDIDFTTTREIALVKMVDNSFKLDEIDLDIGVTLNSWKAYTHNYKKAYYSKSLNRALLVLDYPDIISNMEIPVTNPLEDFVSAVNNVLSSATESAINWAKGFIVTVKETIVNAADIVLTNFGHNRTNQNGMVLFSSNQFMEGSGSNAPSVFTFTIPRNTFNNNTEIDFQFYYPDNEVIAVTESDTFRIISDIFTLSAKYNEEDLLQTDNGNFAVKTDFSTYDLEMASLPSNLIPMVVFLGNNSDEWEVIGSANSTIPFNKLGVYGLAVKISNDVTPPTISVNYPDKFLPENYIDVTVNDTQSGIDWAKTAFSSNGKILEINRIGKSNTFRIFINQIPTDPNGVYTIFIQTLDLAGNMGSYQNVFPCDYQLILQSLQMDEGNPILKKALDKIISNGKTPEGKNLIMQAGGSIELIPGFETKGKTFRAEIKGCD